VRQLNPSEQSSKSLHAALEAAHERACSTLHCRLCKQHANYAEHLQLYKRGINSLNAWV
jgi:hypothetical protein